jgi:hypothetical protein
MGVMSCNRSGCDRVCCDHYSSNYGYLCYGCREELKDKGPCNVAEFMATAPRKLSDDKAWNRYVDDEFEWSHG